MGVLVTGPGAYYDLAVNSLGATSEMFYIWKDTYRDDNRFHVPEFDLAVHRPEVLGGHTRTDFGAMRWALLGLAFSGSAGRREDGRGSEQKGPCRPGMERGTGLPLERIQVAIRRADRTALPGDVWQIGLLRQQVIDQRGNRWQATWTWQPLVVSDGKIPETHLELELSGSSH